MSPKMGGSQSPSDLKRGLKIEVMFFLKKTVRLVMFQGRPCIYIYLYIQQALLILAKGHAKVSQKLKQ